MLFAHPSFGFLFFFYADFWLEDVVFAIINALSSKFLFFCR